MNSFGRCWFPFAALAWGLLLAFPYRANAQPQIPQINPKGIEAFRLILHRSGLRPVANLNDLAAMNPGNTWIIVFGDLDSLQEIDNAVGGLRKFLDNKGAILIASDRAESAELLGQKFNVVPANTVVHNRNPKMAFGGKETFPFVTRFPLPNHPLFRDVTKLATNAPAYLELRGPTDDLHILAQFPEGCTNHNGLPLNGTPVFGVGNDAAQGRKLILAGHGVFMNDEMYHKPDNINFTRNCIDWFTRSRDKNVYRPNVLLYVDGQLIDKFKVRLRRLPGPPIPELELINRTILGLERENFFNKLTLTVAGTGGSDNLNARMMIGRMRILRWLGIVLGALVLMYLFRRLWWGRYHREIKAPLTASHLSGHVSNEVLLHQRQRGMLFEGNLWEAAREVARQCFAHYSERSLTFPPPHPQVVVRASDRRGRLGKQVARLWDLAYGQPIPVHPGRFREILDEAEEVKEALASGDLVLHEPPPAGKTQPPPHLSGAPVLS
jgi:hypothetical protein